MSLTISCRTSLSISYRIYNYLLLADSYCQVIFSHQQIRCEAYGLYVDYTFGVMIIRIILLIVRIIPSFEKFGWIIMTWLYVACFFPDDTNYTCLDYTDYTFGHGLFWLFRTIGEYIFLQWLYRLYVNIHIICIITYNPYISKSECVSERLDIINFVYIVWLSRFLTFVN